MGVLLSEVFFTIKPYKKIEVSHLVSVTHSDVLL